MQRTFGATNEKGPRRGERCPSVAALVGAAAFVVAFAQLTTAAAKVALRVRADSELVNLGSIRSPTTVEVSGGLRDDAGHAIADAAISLPLTTESARPTTCRP